MENQVKNSAVLKINEAFLKGFKENIGKMKAYSEIIRMISKTGVNVGTIPDKIRNAEKAMNELLESFQQVASDNKELSDG